MSIFIALLLGAVQGLTEFIPVSSSGHLILFGEIVDLSNSFVFDVLLNIGTLGALIWYTRERLVVILRKVIKGDVNLAGKIALATVPGVAAGLLFKEFFQGLNDNILLVACMLVAVGILMLFVRQKTKNRTELQEVTWTDALVIGIAQSVALIPGTSRSGSTILAGLVLGFDRKLAAQWSFLMAIPIIMGATVRTLFSREGIEFVGNNFVAVILGNIVSFAVGLLAIHFLMGVLDRHELKGFGVYRIALGALLFILIFANIV